MTLFREPSDVSVRPAVAGDEDAITAIQMGAWRLSHFDVLGEEVLDALDPDQMREQWAQAITAPPGPGFAVLAACAGAQVVGFSAVAPGQIVALEVKPHYQRGGHGSRLLAASVDRLRRDGATEVAVWVLDGDSAREQFLAGAGLGKDGRRRTLATGARDVVEERWVAAI